MTLRSAIAAEHPGFAAGQLDEAAWLRLERLALASPLYGQAMLRRPEICLWVEGRAALPPPGSEAAAEQETLAALRQWRRLASLRIAHRSVNQLIEESEAAAELTRLAEHCLRECLALALRRWSARLGGPWDEERSHPARFCALGLGKLGGGELNFSSDIDLIYCYEGEGTCRREAPLRQGFGGQGAVTNTEFFTKVAETVTQALSAQTADGFLFRVDVRLRPEGAWGPLVHSLSAIENYYSTAGQTWERLALIKARPVAGDLALGAELLEDLHDFRYPRRPPPSLLSEVAAMKIRTEREVVGAGSVDRDVKRGRGGIREIEFVAQSLQLLHAGRNPFLQTHSTSAALQLLARYDLLKRDDALFLMEAYWFLRRVEHALQMREERQTHELPADGPERDALAEALEYPSAEAFMDALDSRRRRVHALYATLFADRGLDADYEAWWEFFTTDRVPRAAAVRLEAWFGAEPGAAEALRFFVCGDRLRMPVTPELVARFQHFAAHFDSLVPDLARPLETLARLGRCADRYGTRRQFLESCAANPQLLRALGLLCDRSGYAVELLCAHPEILEEVLRPEMLRRRKSRRQLAAELTAGMKGSGRFFSGPAGPEKNRPDPFADWLWLYVRAEELRYGIGELLGFLDLENVEAALTRLADAVLRSLLGDERLLVVALGKYGGGELAFGSDLDLLFLAEDEPEDRHVRTVDNIRRLLHHGGPLGPLFAIDLRLRPHGDAGSLVTSLPALAAYHGGGPAASAQTWEKQLLLRARAVAGPAGLAARFQAWVDERLYSAPLSPSEEQSIWAMRGRIERERDAVSPPERAFKTGRGGLADCEFLAQALQMRHGREHPAVRLRGTRAALLALGAEGVIPAAKARVLAANFDFLKGVEFALRRDANRGVAVLPADPGDGRALARWLGFADEAAFWSEHCRRLDETRLLVRDLGGPAAAERLPA